MEPKTSRSQLNVRVSEHVEKLIDNKRIELSKTMGAIPTRSEVLRLALGAYLNVDLSKWEIDGRTTAKK
jgi:hypothetical protein